MLSLYDNSLVGSSPSALNRSILIKTNWKVRIGKFDKIKHIISLK